MQLIFKSYKDGMNQPIIIASNGAELTVGGLVNFTQSEIMADAFHAMQAVDLSDADAKIMALKILEIS